MYREPAVVERYEEPVVGVTFRVRHRSWAWLAWAFVAAAVAAGLVAQIARVAEATLAVAASLMPAVLLGAAFHAACQGASEVELTSTRRTRGRAFDVVLRRRWAFLPWAAPLAFTAPRCPSLVTRWEEGWTSGKNGPSRPYRRASLVVMSGDAEIALPMMRGPSERRGKDLVADLAPAVEEAKRRYNEEAVAVGKVRQRGASASTDGASDDAGSLRLVGSSEGALSWQAAVAALVVVALASAFGLAGWVLPASRLATICCAATLPILGGGIALLSVAVFQGRTLYMRRDREDLVLSIAIADTSLFGPRSDRTRALARDFAFRIEERRVGEDDELVHLLIDATTGEELRRDADANVVRQFGGRMGGRETKPGRDSARA